MRQARRPGPEAGAVIEIGDSLAVGRAPQEAAEALRAVTPGATASALDTSRREPQTLL